MAKKKKEKKQKGFGSTKLLLGIAAIGLVGYYFMGSGSQRYFIVNGTRVPESQLRGMGYIPLNDQWWTPQQIQQAANQGGVNYNAPSGDPAWNVISTILATSAQFIPLMFGGTGTGGNTSGSGGGGMGDGSMGSGGSGGGGGGMEGIYGPSKNQCSRAGYRLGSRGSSADGRALADCRWKK